MKTKTMITRLLKTYPGKKMERYAALAKDLHICQRVFIDYKDGVREPKFHVKAFIKRFYDERREVKK